jgi:hypothetical protein
MEDHFLFLLEESEYIPTARSAASQIRPDLVYPAAAFHPLGH